MIVLSYDIIHFPLKIECSLNRITFFVLNWLQIHPIMVASSLRSNVIVWVINIMNSCRRYLSTKCQVSDSLVCTDIDNSLLVYLMMNVINWIELKKRGQMSRRLINRGVSVIVDVLFFTLFFNDAITKALNTCGNCQRPLFSLSLSQHL